MLYREFASFVLSVIVFSPFLLATALSPHLGHGSNVSLSKNSVPHREHFLSLGFLNGLLSGGLSS